MVSGVTIYYANGAVKVGPSSLASTGIGTVNVSSGYYVNGVEVNGVTSASEPILYNVGSGALSFDYSHAGTFTALQQISSNSSSLQAAQTGTLLQLGQATGVTTRLELDAYGAVPRYTCSRADGTATSPTAVQASDELCSLNVFAHNGAGYVGPNAALRTYAAQNWSVGSNGTYMRLGVTPNGSTTLTDAISIENDGGILVAPAVTGGSKGAGTINAAGLYVNGVAVASSGSAITALTGDVTATGPGSAAATLATVNSNTGSWGSATQSPQFTVNGKGLITTVANVTITPAVGSITGLGTGVATALGINVGSVGAFVVNGGALGTPSSGVATNLSGVATSLTAGAVITNANLTGPITSVGNATAIASQTGTGTKFVVDTAPTISSLTVTTAFTATGLVTNGDLATMVTNTVKGNATSGSASPTDLAVGSCSTAGSALIWTTNTGFGCNTSITANAVPAANLTGSTLAAGVTGSSLTGVGTLVSGATGAGFTVAIGTSTITGNLAIGHGGTGNALTASNGGIVYSDASVLQILAGTATASFPLLSGSTAAPTWATITYPGSATSGGIPYFSSTTAMASSGLLSANALILGGGAGSAPTSLPCSTTTTVLHGGTPPTCGQIVNGDITTATIANSALAVAADSTIKSNISGGSASPSDNTITAVLDKQFGTTQGTVIYRGASAWAALAVGSPGQFLTTQGAAANPTWSGGGAGTGTVTSVTPGNGVVSSVTTSCSQGAITAAGTLSAAECVNAQTGTTYAIVDGDRGKLVTAFNAAAQAYSIAQAGNSSAFQAGYYVDVSNISTNALGVVTITPATSTINGAATLKILPGQSVRITSDGSNYQVSTLTGVRAVKIQKFVVTGTYTPSPGLIYATIECLGGGGGSGGVAGTVGSYFASGGGGSAGYSRVTVPAATIGASQAVTIGAGGSGGAAGTNNGGNGGSSSVGSLCVSNGGNGSNYGAAAQVGAGGSGGAAGTGDIAAAGGAGSPGIYASVLTVQFPGGIGASSIFGGASATIPTGTGALAGVAAGNYGSGASGGAANNTVATAAGAAGSGGIVIITEYTTQ